MIIVLDSYGQLGNRLQICANIIAFASEHNQTVLLLNLQEYCNYFKGPNQVKISNKIKVIVPPPRIAYLIKKGLKAIIKVLSLTQKTEGASYPAIQSIFYRIKLVKALQPPGIVLSSLNQKEFRSKNIFLLQGYYYYSPRLIKERSDVARIFFEPIEKFQNNIKKIISTAKISSDVLVGLHIRHGDYKDYRGGVDYFTFEEYELVMKKMISLFPCSKVSFLICSDENLKESQFSQELSWFSGSGNLIEDMYGLARCDYIIGPFSTFNIWSSFYGEVLRYEIKDPHDHFSLNDFRVASSLG